MKERRALHRKESDGEDQRESWENCTEEDIGDNSERRRIPSDDLT